MNTKDDRKLTELTEKAYAGDEKAAEKLTKLLGTQGMLTEIYDFALEKAKGGDRNAEMSLAEFILYNADDLKEARPDMEAAEDWAERSANHGLIEGMILASEIAGLNGDAEKEKYWIEKAFATGNRSAREAMADYYVKYRTNLKEAYEIYSDVYYGTDSEDIYYRAGLYLKMAETLSIPDSEIYDPETAVKICVSWMLEVAFGQLFMPEDLSEVAELALPPLADALVGMYAAERSEKLVQQLKFAAKLAFYAGDEEYMGKFEDLFDSKDLYDKKDMKAFMTKKGENLMIAEMTELFL